MAFVYIMGDSGQDGCFKIGMTRGDVKKRIKQLQTGNGEEIYLVNYFKTEYPFFIEKCLHTKFFPSQKKNEWFNLNVEDVVKFKEYCEEFEKIAESLKDNPFSKKLLK